MEKEIIDMEDEPMEVLAGLDDRSETYKKLKAEDAAKEQALAWRPKLGMGMAAFIDFGIPKDTYDARMSLLGEEDRKTLEHAFKCGQPGKGFQYLYFGAKPPYNSDWRGTATACVKAAHNDPEQAIRLFDASAAFDADRSFADTVRGMYDEDGKAVKITHISMEHDWITESAKRSAINAQIYAEKKARGQKISSAEKNGERSRNVLAADRKENTSIRVR